MNADNFKQDYSYVQNHKKFNQKDPIGPPVLNLEEKAKQYVLSNAEKGNVKSCIDSIDSFCQQHWMMNLGPEKAIILKDVLEKHKPKTILQLGGYCGYSSLTFSYLTQANIFSVQISPKYAQIAREIQSYAGVSERNTIMVGTVSTLKQEIIKNGPYDIIFIDHAKQLYLSDFLLLQQYKVMHSKSVIIGDNIIYPGAPDYLNELKNRKQYKNTLYHSFVEYSNTRDAVLVSVRNKQ